MITTSEAQQQGGSPLGSGTCSPFFVFDVESIGLHGQAFAVAGGVYDRDGNTLHEFAFHCHPDNADGELSDRDWIMANVSQSTASVGKIEPRGVRNAFWREWLDAKKKWPGITMAVECGWPVEARFLNACIDDDRSERNWSGPYPIHEIASIMLAAGMDPMATYERLPHELPAHEPLADARQSARLLATALKSLVNGGRLTDPPPAADPEGPAATAAGRAAGSVQRLVGPREADQA